MSSASSPGTDRANEDFVAASDRVAVVLDGVSSWYTPESGCVHGTGWFVARLGERIVRIATDHAGRALSDVVEYAIAEVADLHGGACDLAHPWGPAAAVAVVRESADALEYLVLGDCTVLVASPLIESSANLSVFTDDRLGRLDRLARAADAGPELRRHLAEGFCRLRNRPDGYWIASCDPEAGAHSVAGSVPRPLAGAAALFTDGAAALVDVHGRAWPDALRLLHDGGPTALIGEVRRLEDADPDRRRRPRPKAHDDATAVLCVL